MDAEIQQAVASMAVEHVLGKEGGAQSAFAKLASLDGIRALLGVLVLAYLALVSWSSLLFSFRYSVYSFAVCGLLALGEVGNFLTCGPLPGLASVLTPQAKGLA